MLMLCRRLEGTVHVHYLCRRTLDLIASRELPARDVHNCACVQLVAGSCMRTLGLTVRNGKRHTYPNHTDLL